MLLLLWEKLLNLFHNNLKVLEVIIFYIESFCIHVPKLYLSLYFLCIRLMRLLIEKTYELA